MKYSHKNIPLMDQYIYYLFNYKNDRGTYIEIIVRSIYLLFNLLPNMQDIPINLHGTRIKLTLLDSKDAYLLKHYSLVCLYL